MTSTSKTILFLGDCNTSGTPEIEGQAYPDQLAKLLPSSIINCGHTMTTTREGSEYFQQHLNNAIDIVCIQYGLVDAWSTFKYSPYVLYYPDNVWRKIARKLTKKYKKLCKQAGLNHLIGIRNVVPITEYRSRIIDIIETFTDKQGQHSKEVILIETIPNHDLSRNADILRYNRVLAELAQHYPQVKLLTLYDQFDRVLGEPRLNALYQDPTHLSVKGHEQVALQLQALIAS